MFLKPFSTVWQSGQDHLYPHITLRAFHLHSATAAERPDPHPGGPGSTTALLTEFYYIRLVHSDHFETEEYYLLGFR
jgi:hypothetical protein